jgi:chromosomal replication initiator protein
MTPQEFMARVADHYEVRLDQMLGPRRHAAMTVSRRASCWGLRKIFKLSFPEIGQAMAGRHHTTAMFHVRRATLDEARVAIGVFRQDMVNSPEVVKLWRERDALTSRMAVLDEMASLLGRAG